MNEKLICIINDWDPIDFFPMAPKDEYYGEIQRIQEYLDNNEMVNVRDLALKINEIFIQSFGEDVYMQNLEQCIMIAKDIIELLQLGKKQMLNHIIGGHANEFLKSSGKQS